jgi:hypothetical protein
MNTDKHRWNSQPCRYLCSSVFICGSIFVLCKQKPPGTKPGGLNRDQNVPTRSPPGQMRGRGRRQDEQTLFHRGNLYIGEWPGSNAIKSEIRISISETNPNDRKAENSRRPAWSFGLRALNLFRISDFALRISRAAGHSSPTSRDLKTTDNPRNTSTMPEIAHITAGIML